MSILDFLASLGLILAFLLGLRAFVRFLNRRQAEQMVVEYQERFPGRCMICSYHRYGVENGFSPDPLEPHNCIEAKTEADEMTELAVAIEMRDLQKDI